MNVLKDLDMAWESASMPVIHWTFLPLIESTQRRGRQEMWGERGGIAYNEGPW